MSTTSYIFPFNKGCKRVASLSNENVAILAVMNNNRKFFCSFLVFVVVVVFFFCIFTLLEGEVIESDRLKRELINFQPLF